MSQPLQQRAINTIRLLSADAVQKANSGHPGMPMGAAPMAYTLWMRHLSHNPANPSWVDRDRFVLSAGHGSMLLYSLLHLTGYDLSLDELKAFRQWGSLTPGHPEVHHTPGVEMTTGPLGQGFATGVGMAIAERHLAASFNKEGHSIVDHFTYAIVSDGDLMEGVSHEAASLAGHLGLGRLIYLYDANKISIDGSTDLSFTEDVAQRFEAYGWHVVRVLDGNDVEAIDAAITQAKAVSDKPSLVIVHTVIGFGSPNKANTSGVHGEPLGAVELKATKVALGFDPEQSFMIEEDVFAHFQEAVKKGKIAEQNWQERFDAFASAFPAEAAEFLRRMKGELPAGWDAGLPEFEVGTSTATRASSGKVLGALSARLPELIGGSADLTPSNKTDVKGRVDFQRDHYHGQYFRFGVREHAMGAAMNGMALHGGVRPYGGTFLIFSDYVRPAIRLAALMQTPVTYIFTHDSIGLGEDGPTHQPIEQLWSLRAIPGVRVFRPADGAETRESWKAALQYVSGPSLLALSRQNLKEQDHTIGGSAEGVHLGAYVLQPETAPHAVTLIASGSEVEIAVEVASALEAEGVGTRVVSAPCLELFSVQPASYVEETLGTGVLRCAIEAGSTMGWHRYVQGGMVFGIDHFGASAPYTTLYQKFGLDAQTIQASILERLNA